MCSTLAESQNTDKHNQLHICTLTTTHKVRQAAPQSQKGRLSRQSKTDVGDDENRDMQPA